MTKKEAKYFASYIMVRAFTQFFLHTLFYKHFASYTLIPFSTAAIL